MMMIRKSYASWLKIGTLILLFVIYREYLTGEPSPHIVLNLESDSKWSFARDMGRLVFPVVWFGSLFSILLSPFLSIGLLRIPLIITFLTSWVFNVAILTLSTEGGSAGVPRENLVDSATLALFWLERRRLLDSFQTYPELVPMLAAFVLASVILAWAPSKKLSLNGYWSAIACLPVALVIAMAIYTKGGTSAFPTPLGLPIRFASAIAFMEKQDQIAENFHGRQVTVRPQARQFDKIILIMDESVRAGFVDASLIKKLGLIDFGDAVSAGNCSHFSRYVFKRGFQPADLPQILAPNGLATDAPTIWQFAKATSYKTIYIDAIGDAVFHSGMNSDELSYMDERFNIHSRPVYQRDFDALKRLFQAMSFPGPAFIYLDKQGVHHPYQEKYPTGEAEGFDGPAIKPPQDRELREYQTELLERYKKAVNWSVDKFLSDLFAHGLPPNTLLIYTSDHGQSLVENNTKWTHCSVGATTANGEGLVPLLAFASPDTSFARGLAQDAATFRGKYSHFQVFPTLLQAFGYSPEFVTRTYGPSLLDPPPATRGFLKGGDVRRLEWQTVE